MQRFTPLQYIKIDVANNFGNDKDDWDDRIKWFDDNEHQLELLLSEAEEPSLYTAGVMAYRNIMKGEVNHYPISLDATSSGMQILALLTGCRKSAMLCNVLDAGKRMDSYTAIYDIMKELGRIIAMIERKDVKQAIMTALYSSIAIPEEIFRDRVDEFYQTMREEAPEAWKLNEAFLELWDSTIDTYRWTMPDNFHVVIKVIDTVIEKFNMGQFNGEIQRKVHQPIRNGRSLGANTVHSIDGLIVREIVARAGFDPARINRIKRYLDDEIVFNDVRYDSDEDMTMILWTHYMESGFLSARILDYLNAKTIELVDKDDIRYLIESLPKKPFQVLTVHDCFRVLPNYGNDLREQANEVYSLIGKSNMLSYLLTQITGQTINVEKSDKEMWKEVKNANYILS